VKVPIASHRLDFEKRAEFFLRFYCRRRRYTRLAALRASSPWSFNADTWLKLLFCMLGGNKFLHVKLECLVVDEFYIAPFFPRGGASSGPSS
jgi:hypothetical protein